MGSFALVLHTHLPYVRRNGVWPCGEDFFHQAALESYLPILDVLERLVADGIRPGITLGLSPLVAHQMEDPYLLRELTLYLGRVELRAWRQVANNPGRDTGHLHALAAREARAARASLARLGAPPSGIASAFAALERGGAVQLMGGPASHTYLPRTGRELIASHVALGAAEHARRFGRAPAALWLPECAFAPGLGIEEALAREGVRAVVVDPSALDAPVSPVWIADSPVAAFPLDRALSDLVWSGEGYPSGPWYRDFHHYDLEGGFKDRRITGPGGLAAKEPYDPAAAAAQARADAEDFVSQIADRVRRRAGVTVACFDTELFGHWWHEGPAWLEHVLRLIAAHPTLRAITLDEALEEAPPRDRAELREASWGHGRDDRSWVGDQTREMWEALARAEAELAAMDEPHDQMLREYLLATASDWPYMVLRGNNAGYARERFFTHLERFHRLAELARTDAGALEREAATLAEIDDPFPDLSPAREAMRRGVLPAFEAG